MQKNFITAGEAIRDASNPFMAFLDGETASPGDAEVNAFHDPVNGFTLVTNQTNVISPQSGTAMALIPNTSAKLNDATRRELANTCSLMGCARCNRRALVENELSFTLAGEEMACPVCGEDTTFNYVDDSDGETASFATLAEIQAATFSGDDDADAAIYDGIETFIMGSAPMEEKITALGVMMRAMGVVDETPTAADVEQFISEANAFDPDADDFGDDEDDGAGFEMASFSQRWIGKRYELASDGMTDLDEDDPMNPKNATVPGGTDTVTGADTVAGADTVVAAVETVAGGAGGDTITGAATVAGGAGADTVVAETIVGGADDTVAAGASVDTITDSDLTAAGYNAADGEDSAAGGDSLSAPGIELDDSLENLDDTAFGADTFGDDAETTVSVASLIDLSRPLAFSRISTTEIAVFVGSNHIGSLRREASAETASALYTKPDNIERAFAAVFNANRNAVETAAELRQFGFRPVQFRINLGDVAARRVTAARETASAEVATKVAKVVNRNSKVLNLALLGMTKNRFKNKTRLMTELASTLQRSGVRDAELVVRRTFAQHGPEFFATAVRLAGELANKSDEHLNGISETLTDKEFVGGDTTETPTEEEPKVVVSKTPSNPETAGYRPGTGNGNSGTGKVDFGQLVRSVSRPRS